ncbi:MAG: Exodeoxyribonuclease V beta chain, partial [uncultured Lysobacter sp.]
DLHGCRARRYRARPHRRLACAAAAYRRTQLDRSQRRHRQDVDDFRAVPAPSAGRRSPTQPATDRSDDVHRCRGAGAARAVAAAHRVGRAPRCRCGCGSTR